MIQTSAGPAYAQFQVDQHEEAAQQDEATSAVGLPSSVGLGSIRQHRFSPYTMNGGTVAAVAGKDFCVIAADTRLSGRFDEILSRNVTKMHELTSTCILTSAGCKTDIDQLRSVLDIRMKIYWHNHRKTMSISSINMMLSHTLYGKRFFPYYAFNVLGGLDEEGRGVVYGYDAIGCHEKRTYEAAGTGQYAIIPFLDNVINNNNRNEPKPDLSAAEVVELLKEAFVSAGERDVYTGDQLEIKVITASGIQQILFALNAD